MTSFTGIDALTSERAALVRFCARYTDDPHATEDLVQQTLLHAWQHEQQLRDLQARRAWLLSIARTQCLMWARRRGRERWHIVELDGAGERQVHDQFASAFDLELATERDDLLRLLDRALALLPPDMRDLHDRLHTLLHDTATADAPLAAQPRIKQVKAFEHIERGTIDRLSADPAFLREVEQAVAQILAVLYTPLDGGPMRVPCDAWTRSPLMRVLASVTYWLYADELISPAEAARVLYGDSSQVNLARVRRMVERGDFGHYWRPGREDN